MVTSTNPVASHPKIPHIKQSKDSSLRRLPIQLYNSPLNASPIKDMGNCIAKMLCTPSEMWGGFVCMASPHSQKIAQSSYFYLCGSDSILHLKNVMVQAGHSSLYLPSSELMQPSKQIKSAQLPGTLNSLGTSPSLLICPFPPIVTIRCLGLCRKEKSL